MKHRKVFIIAKYADDGAREALNISYDSFSFADSVYGSFSANECGITKTHYEINEFKQAQIYLERLIAYNSTVGYGIVEVEYEGE